jgi:N-acyl-D-aspartate/D-glutamate deacylase
MHDIAIRGGAALVAGTPVFEDGRETGARPGRLVRANG